MATVLIIGASRGIGLETVKERWDELSAFFADMGERPEGMSIDRIDVKAIM